TFTDVGDNIVSSENSFLRYGQMAKIANGEYRRAAMTNDMRYDVEAILKLVDSHTKIIILANPNNPTGTIIYDKEARYLLDRLSENVIVIFDEAYSGFVESPDYPDSIKLQRDYPERPIITLRSFSKIFGLAGARVGYGIANPEIVKYVNIVRGPFNINMLAQAAGCACFSAMDHAAKSKKLCSDEKKYLYNEYEKLGVKYVPTEANFILIKVDESYDGTKMCTDLLKAGIIIRPMGSWGLSDNYMRVTIATHEQNARFITELKHLLTKTQMAAKA
ncbi:MAG TPA: aminotransferase class I/II-fold pyridoxal phosphate-dependent enzyme, partial [Candidatus Wallbacteria bacterium]|nr:aminotransferase class I/II-fold pyridoxal phosphate-dependent enzyme [Candidatus Wallbacteria bacterium]